jgi:hypothetical protein
MEGHPGVTGHIDHGVAVPHARTRGASTGPVPRLSPALFPAVCAAVPRLPEQIAARIRSEVVSFGGPRRRLHGQLREAVAVAVDGFVRTMAGDDAARAQVEAHFRGLGRIEAQAGHSVQRVLAAIQVANDSVWQAIHAMVAREELAGSVVADLGVAVTRYLTHLAAEVQRGFTEAYQAGGDVRTRLVIALMQESAVGGPGDVAELAEAAHWRPPEYAVVVVAQLHGFVPRRAVSVPSEALLYADGDRLVVVTAEEHVPQVTEALLRLDPRVLVAQSWSVPLLQARHAYRWARRALHLARTGEVRIEGRVVRCAMHRLALWLAADQALADDISRELLAPLHAEKPHNRLMLAETMLRWLETGESAPAMAAYFRTHPHTIRNRMHKLRDLFGAQLDDANQRLALIVALGTALPRWRRERRLKPRR